MRNKNPYVIPALLVPKKMAPGKCVDSQAINKIAIYYRFLIPRLDDLLGQLSLAIKFSNIDLGSEYHHICMRGQ